MKAWVIHRFGLDALALEDRATPTPGPHQVLVRVRAASLNYRDRMVVDGLYAPGQTLPLIPISDGAGEVVALGAGVTELAVGDRVVGAFIQRWLSGPATAATAKTTLGSPRDGVLAEYVVLDEVGAVRIPDSLSFEQAATLPIAAVTAWHALFGDAPVAAGDSVVIQGTGGVAAFAIQLARAAGARVIATSSRDDKLERARQLGAHDLINYATTPAWDARVRELTAGAGAALVLDVAGGALDRSIAAVRNGGQVALVGLLAGLRGDFDLIPVLSRNVRLQGIHVGSRADLEHTVRAVVHHRIQPAIARTYAFGQAREALAAIGGGDYVGKLVITGA